jgi:hypothetical protein
VGYQAASALFVEADWQPGGFLFQGAKTEARRTRLCNHKAAVFEQEFSRLRKSLFASGRE